MYQSTTWQARHSATTGGGPLCAEPHLKSPAAQQGAPGILVSISLVPLCFCVGCWEETVMGNGRQWQQQETTMACERLLSTGERKVLLAKGQLFPHYTFILRFFHTFISSSSRIKSVVFHDLQMCVLTTFSFFRAKGIWEWPFLWH